MIMESPSDKRFDPQMAAQWPREMAQERSVELLLKR
jgi:hypothetical protein